jgi:predicted dehydrogenase
MSASLRFGFAGLGWATRSLHLPALAKIPELELVGGCDLSPEQRAAWESQTGTKAHAGLDELIEAASPDVVVVATPPDSHAQLCVQALERGCHVFCEKPFASSLEEADRVLAVAEAAGREVAVNHEFREQPIFKALREQIAAQAFGRLVFCQIWQLMDLAPWDEAVPWRAAMNDRTLLEGGVHLVDLLLGFYGEPPEAVYARRSSGLRADQAADAIHLVTLEFPQGRLAQITIDRLCPAATRYVEVRADCEEASLRASLGGRSLIQLGKKRAERTGVRVDFGAGGLAWMERGLKRKTLARNGRNAIPDATAALLKQFVAALQTGSEPPSSGHEARDVLAVIEAAYRSAETGARVRVPPPPAPSRLPRLSVA